jgi:hypothetical protein
MTFVNELISEEDKAKYDWSKFKAWDFSWPLRPWKWTIDREKDVFFVGLEGQGRESERPETYALYWKGFVIRLEVEITGHLNGKFWDEIYWKILRMSIPVEIEMNRDEIILDLREAIDAYGRFHDRSDIKSVKINFLLGE